MASVATSVARERPVPAARDMAAFVPRDGLESRRAAWLSTWGRGKCGRGSVGMVGVEEAVVAGVGAVVGVAVGGAVAVGVAVAAGAAACAGVVEHAKYALTSATATLTLAKSVVVAVSPAAPCHVSVTASVLSERSNPNTTGGGAAIPYTPPMGTGGGTYVAQSLSPSCTPSSP